MIRLFAGLAFPDDVAARLAGMMSGIPGARWTPKENLHLTLRFIGEVDEVVADDLHDALAEVRADRFDLVLRGCGAFESGHRAHTLWVGADLSSELQVLHDRVEAAAQRAGLPPERRKYTPHVTLARLKDAPLGRVQDYISGNNLLRLVVPIHHFTLFSSHLGRGEPVYRPEMEYPLVE